MVAVEKKPDNNGGAWMCEAVRLCLLPAPVLVVFSALYHRLSHQLPTTTSQNAPHLGRSPDGGSEIYGQKHQSHVRFICHVEYYLVSEIIHIRLTIKFGLAKRAARSGRRHILLPYISC